MKVISGGQTGADQAGLRAAKAVGLETGGWLPYGCRTLKGECRDLLIEYDMQEHPKRGYPARTEANVRDSDGTLRFAANFGSAGERCTMKAIRWFGRPHFDVDIKNFPSVEVVFDWIFDKKIKVLNIAGNSEETAPGIEEKVYEYLLGLFQRVKDG
jgi:hypothetical protein